MANSESSSALIKISDLHFSQGAAGGGRKIFDGVDIEIERGRITAIMGPSGAGKTTLLKLIGGQLRPDQGMIEVDGENVHTLSRSKLYALRKKMGMLFQSGALLTDLTVFENVAFPLREHTRLPELMIRDLVLMKLEAVGLRGARELMPAELSGGMARRVALARAIALEPMMVLYDEPLTGQDPITMGVLIELIKKLNHALDITSIIVSHDVAEITALADYIYLISEGEVVARGTPAELARTESPFARQFMQGLADGPVPFHYPAPDYASELMAVK